MDGAKYIFYDDDERNIRNAPPSLRFLCFIDDLQDFGTTEKEGTGIFTLVLTKNYSNLVAGLSYCSDEGN